MDEPLIRLIIEQMRLDASSVRNLADKFSPVALVGSNLQDRVSRHVLVVSATVSSWQLMLDRKIVTDAELVFESAFEKDHGVFGNLNLVKNCKCNLDQ